MGLTNAKIQLRNPRLPELEAVEIDALADTGGAARANLSQGTALRYNPCRHGAPWRLGCSVQ